MLMILSASPAARWRRFEIGAASLSAIAAEGVEDGACPACRATLFSAAVNLLRVLFDYLFDYLYSHIYIIEFHPQTSRWPERFAARAPLSQTSFTFTSSPVPQPN